MERYPMNYHAIAKSIWTINSTSKRHSHPIKLRQAAQSTSNKKQDCGCFVIVSLISYYGIN